MSGTVVAVPPRVARALDLLNFSLADVRDGLGPYLSIYLLLIHDWDQASIGFVMAVGGIAAIVAQTPIGALVDRTTAKRALVVAGAVLVTAAAVAMPLFAGLYSISVLQAVTGIASSVFARRWRRSRWVLSVLSFSPDGLGVTKRSTTPVTRRRLGRPARWRTSSGRWWCSGCWPAWR